MSQYVSFDEYKRKVDIWHDKIMKTYKCELSIYLIPDLSTVVEKYCNFEFVKDNDKDWCGYRIYNVWYGTIWSGDDIFHERNCMFIFKYGKFIKGLQRRISGSRIKIYYYIANANGCSFEYIEQWIQNDGTICEDGVRISCTCKDSRIDSVRYYDRDDVILEDCNKKKLLTYDAEVDIWKYDFKTYLFSLV
jgi:hypothetical protein